MLYYCKPNLLLIYYSKVMCVFLNNISNVITVFSRDGKAIRLTYDHKASDSLESRRITEAGGFVLNKRVNGNMQY